MKFYPGFRNLIKTLICRFICVVVSLFVCISDLFSSRIFWKYVACVFFSSRIEIHCFIKGKLPEKSRCKILSARFPKTQFSWYFFILVFICIFQETVNQYKYRVLWALEYVLLKAKYPLGKENFDILEEKEICQLSTVNMLQTLTVSDVLWWAKMALC